MTADSVVAMCGLLLGVRENLSADQVQKAAIAGLALDDQRGIVDEQLRVGDGQHRLEVRLDRPRRGARVHAVDVRGFAVRAVHWLTAIARPIKSRTATRSVYANARPLVRRYCGRSGMISRPLPWQVGHRNPPGPCSPPVNMWPWQSGQIMT